MSGRHRSSVDGQLTQQNIGKFVNINKTNKDKEVDKGEPKDRYRFIGKYQDQCNKAIRTVQHNSTKEVHSASLKESRRSAKTSFKETQ